MILPLVLLAANVAIWWFVNDIRQVGDEGVTSIAFLVGLAMLGWFLLELYYLTSSVRSEPDDSADAGE